MKRRIWTCLVPQINGRQPSRSSKNRHNMGRIADQKAVFFMEFRDIPTRIFSTNWPFSLIPIPYFPILPVCDIPNISILVGFQPSWQLQILKRWKHGSSSSKKLHVPEVPSCSSFVYPSHHAPRPKQWGSRGPWKPERVRTKWSACNVEKFKRSFQAQIWTMLYVYIYIYI